jgi:hypothetical protein
MNTDRTCKINWGVYVSCLLLLLTSACQPSTEQATPPTSFPSPTATSIPSLTPTFTPIPSPTPDPIIVQAQTFMNLSLESIADKPPDYQDDFSNPHSGWPVGAQPYNDSGHEDGIVGYENGEYFITAAEAKYPHENDPQLAVTCQSAFHSPKVTVWNFVMAVDARFPTLDESEYWRDWQMKFWEESNYYYGVIISPDGQVSFHTSAPPETFLDSNDRLETTFVSSFDYNGGLNHLVVVADNSTIAMTLNGEVVVYIDNLPPREPGPIGFVVCNFSPAPFRAQWDNLKIWRLPDQ